jgi:hypothetical protein
MVKRLTSQLIHAAATIAVPVTAIVTALAPVIQENAASRLYENRF